MLIDDNPIDKDKTNGSDIWYRDCPWYGCPSASVTDTKANPLPRTYTMPVPEYPLPGPTSNASIRDKNPVTGFPSEFTNSLDKNPIKSPENEYMLKQKPGTGGTRKRKRRFRKSRK